MAYELGPADPEPRGGLHADPRDEEPPRQQRRVLAIFVALVVMATFAGGLWFAYSQGARHSPGAAVADSDVPLIRADPRPTKVKPEEPGGMQIPDRDKLIYAQTRSAQVRPAVEHLLPPPEKPLARPTAPPPAAAGPAATPTPQIAEATPAPAEAAPPPPAVKPQPRADEPAKPQQRAEAAMKPQQHAGVPAAPKPTAAHPSASTGGARIQLGSVRTEGQARQEWNRIKSRNADLLGGLSATPIRADLGDRGVYWRIQAGPVGDSAKAERLCGELKQRSVGCILVR